jgi:hypothetical protein
MKRNFIIISVLVAFTLLGCKEDHYDSGDGEYSYIKADFVEAHTVSSKEINYVITDDGDSLVLSPHVSADWAAKSDSDYRALLYYYNNVDNNTTTAYSISRVPVVAYHPLSDFKEIHTDPVNFESAWVSTNHKYLNIGFYVKTGQQDASTNSQTISIINDGIVSKTDGTHELCLRMYHDQNGVPEYYSTKGYISIPVANLKGYIIHLSINTYNGMITKDFTI